MTTKTRETRRKISYRFDPAKDSADLPDKFVLKMDIEDQVRDGRVASGWVTEHSDIGVTVTPQPMTRNQLAALLGDGASMLAYLGDNFDQGRNTS